MGERDSLRNMSSAYFPINRRLHKERGRERKSERERKTERERDRGETERERKNDRAYDAHIPVVYVHCAIYIDIPGTDSFKWGGYICHRYMCIVYIYICQVWCSGIQGIHAQFWGGGWGYICHRYMCIVYIYMCLYIGICALSVKLGKYDL